MRRWQLSLAVVVLAAGASDAAGRPPRPTRAVAATGALRLPVVRCKVQYGVPGPHPRAESDLRAAVRPAIGTKLSFYVASFLVVLAPRGWACDGLLAADGNVRINVHNPRGGFFRDATGSY